MRGGACGEIRLRQVTLGGLSLALTASVDHIVTATAFLHVTDERGRPPCGPAHLAVEFEGDLGSARAPPKRVDFGREQGPRQSGRNDLCTYAGPCPTRLVTGLDHVGGLWCGPYRARMSVHLQRSLGLAAMLGARAPPPPARHATQSPSTGEILRPPSAAGDGCSSFARASRDAAGLAVERDRIRTHFGRANGEGAPACEAGNAALGARPPRRRVCSRRLGSHEHCGRPVGSVLRGCAK